MPEDELPGWEKFLTPDKIIRARAATVHRRLLAPRDRAMHEIGVRSTLEVRESLLARAIP